jgi:hypothetical protein
LIVGSAILLHRLPPDNIRYAPDSGAKADIAGLPPFPVHLFPYAVKM